MIVCPYKDMKKLSSLPCSREQQGKWVYCTFCGQKYQLDIPPDPPNATDQLIWILLTALMMIVLGRSLFVSNSIPEPHETLTHSNSAYDLSDAYLRRLKNSE